jgi:hypothetical protein
MGAFSGKLSVFILGALSLAGAVMPAHAQSLSFQSAVNYPTGLRPTAVVTGDLNNDTYPDIVTANANSNDVSVFLNQGDGTFAAAVSYSVGNSPRSLVLADFNADGHLDVAVANFATGRVAVRLGSATGVLGANAQYDVGLQPTGIAAGDMNGDGKPDIVTVGGAGTTTVLLNDGSGTVWTRNDIAGGDAATSVSVADVDENGSMDIISTSNTAHRMTIRFGSSTGAFAAPVYVELPTGGALSLRVADLDNDLHLDLLTANTGNGSVGSSSLREGDGTGTFTNGGDPTLGIIPVAVELGDLNADLIPEVLFANRAQGSVCIGVGIGDGTFGELQHFTTDTQTNSVAVADFNKDGKPDVVTANAAVAPTISVLINTTPIVTRTISGNIELQETLSSAVPMTFEFTPTDGTLAFLRSVTPDIAGNYTVSGIPVKTYSLRINAPKWLQAVVSVSTIPGDVTELNIIMRGGDANLDNMVDIDDLLDLIAHYNAVFGTPAYLDAADFNNDGLNDISDLLIVISNYNRVGD